MFKNKFLARFLLFVFLITIVYGSLGTEEHFEKKHLVNPIVNTPQYLGTATISLAVQFDKSNNPSHAGIIVSGYGYAAKPVNTCVGCCSAEIDDLKEGVPPMIASLEHPDSHKSGFAKKVNGKDLWAIGFHLMPKDRDRIFCASGEVLIWNYAEIEQVISSGYSHEGYHYDQPCKIQVLYEDAKTLIKRALRAVTGLDKTCYHLVSGPCSLIGHNCGSFAVMLMRKANIPVPHVGDCCDLILPCRVSTLESCQRRTHTATKRYKKEHRLLLRKGADGLTLCNRLRRLTF